MVGEDDRLDLNIRRYCSRNVEIDSLVELSLCPCRCHSADPLMIDSLVEKLGSGIFLDGRRISSSERSYERRSSRDFQDFQALAS